jgi:homoserine dehydrogenase
MELRFGFVGFGNVARAFARILHSNGPRLAAECTLRWRTTAIATANHGCVVSGPGGIDLTDAADVCEKGGSLPDAESWMQVMPEA